MDIFSDQFLYGVLAGAFLALLLSELLRHSYRTTLLLKGCSDHRTPEKLPDGCFYYIVPESEYNHLQRLQLQEQQQERAS